MSPIKGTVGSLPMTLARFETSGEFSKDEETCEIELLEKEPSGDFGVYQLVLFIITQLGYLPVTGAMLATTFFQPQTYCSKLITTLLDNSTSLTLTLDGEFHSLLIEWHEHCQEAGPINISTITGTFIMLGAVFGSFLSGFFADRWGRKPTVVGTMLLLFLGHASMLFYASRSKYYAIFIFFILGCASGGYIVTNLVLMIESLEKARSRLLVVSLNGWPIGMTFVALTGYLTKNWRTYHIVMSTTAGILLIILQLFSFESVRWLLNHGRTLKADKVQGKINNRNKLSPFCSSVYLNLPVALPSDSSTDPFKKAASTNICANEIHTTSTTISDSPLCQTTSKYTYLDLFRYRSVLLPLLALSFSFTSNSIISFGTYFSLEILPGDRYINMAAMGVLKLLLGFLPFIFSLWAGRRPILLISIGVACFSAWLLVGVKIFDCYQSNGWFITMLVVIITASLDPAWKINHLYSAELFPTVVRNMARGVCNVGARIGSLLSPGLIALTFVWAESSFIIFSVFLTFQLIVVFFLLPETKNQPLFDEIAELQENNGDARQAGTRSLI